MNTIYLRDREQVTLLQARSASSDEARLAHEGLARLYEARLRRTAKSSGINPPSRKAE